jgi:cobalt/nickel transport system permease protein
MHIPDGFLSTPVWLSLDVIAAPAIAYFGKRAQADTDESRAPLLGVMGAFVFAAQMINFPVGPGVSGHLVGSALLTYTVGPAAAVVVMTAILALQALVFQDGGLLALGANVINMAVVGVALAYLPYRLWGRSGANRAAVFLGATLSVFVAACLAVVELLLSGIPMAAGVLAVAMGLFALMALIEGAITVAVLEALQKLNPGWIQAPAKSGSRALTAVVVTAVLLVTVGVLFASANPDGLEKLAEELGVSEQARTLIETPLADYEAAFVNSSWSSQALAGIIGVLLTVGVCLLLAKLLARRKV